MNNKGADQTARMRRLICTFVVCIWHMTHFRMTWPIRFFQVLCGCTQLYWRNVSWASYNSANFTCRCIKTEQTLPGFYHYNSAIAHQLLAHQFSLSTKMDTQITPENEYYTRIWPVLVKYQFWSYLFKYVRCLRIFIYCYIFRSACLFWNKQATNILKTIKILL